MIRDPWKLDLSRVRPWNRGALLTLESVNAEHARWRAELARTVAGLIKLHMASAGMWGIEIKGRPVLGDYDMSTEAWAEANSAKARAA